MANLFTNFISKILKKITSPDVPTEVQLENRLYLSSRPQSDTRHLEKINFENDFENPQEQEREINCDCEYKNNCQGGCRASAYAQTRSIKGEDGTCYIK